MRFFGCNGLAWCWVLLLSVFSGCESTEGKTVKDYDKYITDLRNPDIAVRKAGAEGLLQQALSEEGRQVILKQLNTLVQIVVRKIEDTNIRASVMRAIVIAAERRPQPVDEKLLAELITVLLDEKEEDLVRGWVAIALPYIARKEVAASALFQAAESKSANVRVNAAQQVTQIGLKPDTLILWASSGIKDPKPQVRLVAMSIAFGLAKKDRRASALLMEAMKDREPMVRQSTVRSVALLDLRADIELRMKMEQLLDDPDPTVAMTSAVALLNALPESTKYASALMKGMESKSEDMRAAAASALVVLGPDPEAVKITVPTLKKLVKDPSDRVKVQAAMSLIRLTGKKAPYLKVLEEMKSSKNDEVSYWALYYLSLVADKGG